MIDSRLLAGLKNCFPWTAWQMSQLINAGAPGVRAARMRAERLVQKGLLCTAVLDSQQITLDDEPLMRSTDERFDVHRAAYQLEQRFAGASRPVRIYWPSRMFAGRYGSWTGSDRYPCPHKISHDLIVTDVWLKYLRFQPTLALLHWQSERFLISTAASMEKVISLPDAAICVGDCFKAIEIGGNYPASWIQHHIDRFQQSGWAWEIW
jgi:hypothetical protein